jgi:hypothetical protein
LGGNELPAQFPTQSELQNLKGAQAPARLTDPAVREVDNFDLKDSPVQPPDGNHTPASPWEQLLADAAETREGLLSTPESMNCLAKLMGQFYLSNGGVPSLEVSQFLASRCAVVDTETATFYNTGTVSGTMSNDQLFDKTRASVQEGLQKYLTSGNQTAGIWFGRADNRVVVMTVFASHRIALDQVPFLPGPDGHVVLRGEILVPVEHVEALINYGRFGVKRCAVDSRIQLPRFSLDCETNHTDVSASLEIGVFPPARLTGKVMSHLTIWPSGQVSTQYAKPSYGTKMQAPVDADVSTSLVSLLNTVRKEAGLSPVTLNVEESATAAAVAPHYFAAMAGASPESTIDQVVMGLRAGWQIPGLVGYGHFTSSVTRDTSNAAQLLASALDRPAGREALLDPATRVLAVGPVLSKKDGILAAVFSTYAFIEPTASPQEVGEVVNLLAERRNGKGLKTSGPDPDIESSVIDASRRVELGTSDPSGAMQEALQDNRSPTSGVQAWFMATENLQRLAFPEKLLTEPKPRYGVGVCHYKPPNFPWALRGVLIVMKVPVNTTAANGSSLSQDNL